LDRFEIERIFPLGYPDLWGAEITVRTAETINDVEVGQNASLTVRFMYPEDQPASGLLEAATRKAEECLVSATAILNGQSASELQAAVRAEQEAQQAEWDKPFEFPTIGTDA